MTAPGAVAQTKATGTDARLQEVERALDQGREKTRDLKVKSQALESEVVNLRRELIEAARIIQQHEQTATELSERLKTLGELEVGKSKNLLERRRQFGKTLMALQRVARHPPEALIAQPKSPAETVRSAILLRAAVPEIERRAVRLSEELDFLVKTRAETQRRKAELDIAAENLATERKRLGLLLARKSVLMRRTVSQRHNEETRLARLTDEAQELRDLMSRLDADRRARQRQAEDAAKRKHGTPSESAAPSSTTATKNADEVASISASAASRTLSNTMPPRGFTHRPISKQRGRLPYPAVGKIIGHYGERMDTGLTRKGIDLETRGGAQVVAAYEGKVVFSGPFRAYGLLLIIEHSEGYHSLMAGMSRIDVAVGQWVLAGEPVGIMAGGGGGNGTSGKPILYVEFRRDGQPVNPIPWLTSDKEKASG